METWDNFSHTFEVSQYTNSENILAHVWLCSSAKMTTDIVGLVEITARWFVLIKIRSRLNCNLLPNRWCTGGYLKRIYQRWWPCHCSLLNTLNLGHAHSSTRCVQFACCLTQTSETFWDETLTSPILCHQNLSSLRFSFLMQQVRAEAAAYHRGVLRRGQPVPPKLNKDRLIQRWRMFETITSGIL